MELFIHVVTRISQFCGIVAAALIASVSSSSVRWCSCATYSTLTRSGKPISPPIRWLVRPSSAAPYVLLTRGHVNVDVLPLYLGQKARYWLALATIILSLAFCAVARRMLTFNFWHEAWEQNWVSDTMWRARLWIPYSTMPIGLGLISLQYVVDLICPG